MSVAVFGSSGFVGKEVMNLLAANKIKHFGFSRTKNEQENSVVDITKKADFERINFQPEVVVICAAKLPGSYTPESLIEYFDVNLVGVSNILNWARESGTKRIVYCSTMSVIGEEEFEKGIVNEDSTAYNTGPHYQYTTSKLAGEILCSAFCNQNNMSSVNLRISSVYGSGMQWSGVLCSLIDKVRNVEPVTLSNPNITVDFIHVSDVANCIYHSITSKIGGIVNITSGNPVSLGHLLDLIMENSGIKKLSIQFDSKEPKGLRKIDVARMNLLLGGVELKELKTGILELIQYRNEGIDIK